MTWEVVGPRRETLMIPGPAGVLEALLEVPDASEPKAMALVCHPHPLHGGTMDNKVVYTLARAFIGLGAVALRFNFRGVGESEGNYDDGRGEADDAVAAAAALRARWPNASLCIAGFSFGAIVALHVATQLRPRLLITVAPPVERLDPSAGLPRDAWLVVHGSDDVLIAVDSIIVWLDALPPGPALTVIDGADHFFHGKLTELRAAVEGFAAPLLDANGTGR